MSCLLSATLALLKVAAKLRKKLGCFSITSSAKKKEGEKKCRALDLFLIIRGRKTVLPSCQDGQFDE